MEQTDVERQENELEVLKAIFENECKDLRENDKWKAKRPPELEIKLTPQESMNVREVYVSATLYVKCTPSYPNLAPEVRLINTKGLSTRIVSDFNKELEEKAKALVGEVMILQLCDHTRSFLHAQNQPPTKSFYDEMISNNQKEYELKLAQQQRKIHYQQQQEELQRRLVKEEIQKRQEAIKEEDRLYRDTNKMDDIVEDSANRLSVSPDVNSFNPQRLARQRRTSTPRQNSGSSDGPDEIEYTPTVEIKFRMKPSKVEQIIHKGRCIHTSRHASAYIGLDSKTGEPVTITEWMMKWRHANRKLNEIDRSVESDTAENYLKQIASIEHEFMSILKLRHHHLVHFLALKSEYNTGHILVHLLSEHVGGHSLSTYITQQRPMLLEHLRYCTDQILRALVYLHNQNVVHKNLNANSVYLDNNNCIRLADYSITYRLNEVHKSIVPSNKTVQFCTETELPVYTYCKSGKKADVYKLGVLMLALIAGEEIMDQVPEIPAGLPYVVEDFIAKCLIKELKDRSSASDLLNHSFLKTPLNITIPHKNNTSQDSRRKDKEDKEDNDDKFDLMLLSSGKSGHSRLDSDFVPMELLGKGAFGGVIKVKNKLDGRFYAIKRIPINPRSAQFTRKITREVKLLSRLSHDNIVRYYNSWMEVSSEPPSYIESPSISITTTESTTASQLHAAAAGDRHGDGDACAAAADKKQVTRRNNKASDLAFCNSLGFDDNIEALVPDAAVDDSVQWGDISAGHHATSDTSRSNSSSDEENEDIMLFGQSFLISDSDDDDESDEDSDGIVFEGESPSCTENIEASSKGKQSPTTNTTDDKKQQDINVQTKILYIQMEFCEKSTLRNLIDEGLYQNEDRVWRLFREILEGLYYIHSQSIVHRDLKPVNVFLDSNDHVKIGDFGLATTDILSKDKVDISMMSTLGKAHAGDSLHLLSSGGGAGGRGGAAMSDQVDDSRTGVVGTALYMSPEVLNAKEEQTQYTAKVDIYSLGIMFFEMCYRPLTTGHERVQILNNIRHSSIKLPPDMNELHMSNQIELIRQMLSHDVQKRPTTNDLLHSSLLPALPYEEEQLNLAIRNAVTHRNTAPHRQLLANIFSTPVNSTTDRLYHAEVYKLPVELSRLRHDAVRISLVKLFRRHGAINFSTPLLMPNVDLYSKDQMNVQLMDHGGGLVMLPYDLRVPFARYVAQCSREITHLKRYTVDRVYKEKKMFDTHPKELWECAFDIVTTQQIGCIADAEVITIVNDVVNEYSHLQSNVYRVRMNHTLLLESILLYAGIPKERHKDVYRILTKPGLKTKQQSLQTNARLLNLSLTEDNISVINKFVSMEGQYNNIQSMLRQITKGKQAYADLAKEGLKDIGSIINHLKAFGCQLQVTVALGELYNVHMYSGAFFRILPTVKGKKRSTQEALAAGGRYDGLVEQFRTIPTNKPVHAVGVSLSYDRIVSAAENSDEFQKPCMYDVVVHSIGKLSLVKEKLALLKQFWDAGINAGLCQEPSLGLDDLLEYCRVNDIPNLALLKENDSGHVRIKSYEKETNKMIEKRVPVHQAADHLLHSLSRLLSASESLASAGNDLSQPSSTNVNVVSASKDVSSWQQQQPNVHIKLQLNDQKPNRKRYEMQISNSISKTLMSLSNKTTVHVLAVDVADEVIRTIAAHLQIHCDKKEFDDIEETVKERHTKWKKHLNEIFPELHTLIFGERESPSVVIVYSVRTDFYKVFL